MSTKKQDDYIIITGKWTDGKAIDDFISNAGLQTTFAEGFQVNQTFSTYRLEKFSLVTKPEAAYLEQYRAFSAQGELWIRRTEKDGLRFRLIVSGKSEDELRTKIAAYALDGKDKLDKDFYLHETDYPLWGEPLAGDESKGIPQGWYTQQIPRIQDYPVPFPIPVGKQRVYLKTEEWLRPDGTVEVVRFTGLEMR